jgi:RNase P subunit RPR2
MVKIVDPGPDPSVVKRRVCTNCGAVLEYVPRDIQHRSVTDYTGDSDVVYFIVCPQCNDKQNVKRM